MKEMKVLSLAIKKSNKSYKLTNHHESLEENFSCGQNLI